MIDIICRERGRPSQGATERKCIRAAVRHTLKSEGIRERCAVSVTLTGARLVRELNAAYRGVDATTDVLSFPLLEPGERPAPPFPAELGDIVIDCERVAYQAGLYGLPYLYELAYMVIHSTLHLLGYDHMAPEEETVMTELQEKYISELEEQKLWQ